LVLDDAGGFEKLAAEDEVVPGLDWDQGVA
jgi:hypothetical protein